MSVLLGKELTNALFTRLDGKRVDQREGKALIIVTVDEKGWPHPAMLSYYEVVAKDRSTIDLAIGKNGTTAKNLRSTGRMTLLITDRDTNYYIKGSTREIREDMEGVPFMSLFRFRTEQLLEDQEPGAPITSGVTFSRPAKKEVRDLVEKVFRGVLTEPLV